MKLKTLTNLLKSGSLALGQKLSNLLTEDCVILEYTDDSVLFTKNNRLVLAKFKHNLTEATISPEDVLDNEVIVISGKETEALLKTSLTSVVDSLAENNYVNAEEALREFSEVYYQSFVLKNRYPELFNENLVKKSPGLVIRKKAYRDIPAFRSDVFSAIALRESSEDEALTLTATVEKFGHVLLLGEEAIKPVIVDAVLGNESLAEQIVSKLYEIAETLTEANTDLVMAKEAGYDFRGGKFDEEDPEEVASEDLSAPDEMVSEFPSEDEGEPKTFEEFDPSKLSDEDVKNLHVEVLKSILTAMADFVSKKANDPEETEFPADLEDQLKSDLDALNDVSLADEDLSSIEARWQPTLDYFLDSDLYKADQDIEEPEISADEIVPGGENPESVKTPEEEEMPSELPPAPGAPEEEVPGELPPAPKV